MRCVYKENPSKGVKLEHIRVSYMKGTDECFWFLLRLLTSIIFICWEVSRCNFVNAEDLFIRQLGLIGIVNVCFVFFYWRNQRQAGNRIKVGRASLESGTFIGAAFGGQFLSVNSVRRVGIYSLGREKRFGIGKSLTSEDRREMILIAGKTAATIQGEPEGKSRRELNLPEQTCKKFANCFPCKILI